MRWLSVRGAPDSRKNWSNVERTQKKMITSKMRQSRTSLAHLIAEHVARHPVMEPCDVYKLLYQGVLGLEHLVASPKDFAARLRTEYEIAPPCAAEPLWEPVRPDGALVRLNLRPFKAGRGDVEQLITACLQTAQQAWGTPEELRAAWATFVELGRVGTWETFPLLEVLALSAWIEEHGYPAIHHSARYREANEPAYRVICSEFLSYLKMQEVKDV